MNSNFWKLILRAFNPSSCLAVAACAAFFPFGRVQFDAHHDGYMLASVLGFSSGLALHSGVINQYGPLTTFLHRGFLALPSGPALDLRLATVGLIGLTVFFVADLGRVTPASWGVTKRQSRVAAALWLVLNDAWRGIPVLPWSSVAATCIAAFGVWVTAKSLRRDWLVEHRRLRALLPLAAGGFFLGMIPFARINVGIALLIGLGALAVAFPARTDQGRSRRVSFTIGVLAALGTTFYYLAATGSAAEYLVQAILGPRQFAASMAGPDGWNSVNWLISTGLREMIPIALLLGVATWLIGRRTTSASKASTALAVFLCAAFIFVSRIQRADTPFLAGLRRGLLLQTQPSWDDFGLLQFFTFAGLLACVVHIGLRLFRRLTQSPTQPIGAMLIPVAGLACLVQIYPAWDSRHLWWGLPLALIPVTQFVETLTRQASASLTLVFAAMLVTLPSAIPTGLSTIRENSVEFADGGPLRGMRGTEQLVGRLQGASDFTANRLGPRSAVFLAADGYLSVSSGQYRSIDAFFVSWDSNIPRLVERVAERPDVISDHDEERLVELTNGSDYFLASRAADLSHLLAPPCIAGNCPEIKPDDVCMAWGSCRPRSTPTPLELVPNTSFSPVTPWNAWDVKVNAGFSYPENDGAWITGHHARLTFTDVAADTVRISLYPFLPPEWTHIDVSVLTDTNAVPIRLNDGITTIDLPVKPNAWNELVFRCDTLHRPSQVGLGEDQRLLCAKVVGFEPISPALTP